MGEGGKCFLCPKQIQALMRKEGNVLTVFSLAALCLSAQGYACTAEGIQVDWFATSIKLLVSME